MVRITVSNQAAAAKKASEDAVCVPNGVGAVVVKPVVDFANLKFGAAKLMFIAAD